MNRRHFLPGLLKSLLAIPGFNKYKPEKASPSGSAIYPTYHHNKKYRGFDAKKYHHKNIITNKNRG